MMIKEYTLERHSSNISLLEHYISMKNEKLSEIEMLNLVNILADFIQANPQYSFIDSFSIITDLIADAIIFCNSNKYNLVVFIEMYNIIISYIKKITREIIRSYNINVYFSGYDKYKLINKIFCSNVNLIIGFHRTNKVLNQIREFNVLVVSEETTVYIDESFNYDAVIYYDKFMNDVFNVVEKLYNENYDYNYLFNSVLKAKNDWVDSIIVGSSYSLFGMDETKFNDKIVNLSLPSQDLYYSFKIAKEVIGDITNIKRCYIGTSYWMFHFDLSRSVNSEIERIKNVYFPLFKDSNHFKYSTNKKVRGLNDYMNDINKLIFNQYLLYNCFSKLINKSHNTYFNNKRTRQSCSEIHKFELLDEESKFNLGKERAEVHNKLIKYNQTKIENEHLLKRFLEYLHERNVQPVIINFPVTKYYYKFFNKEFVFEYYNIINNLKIENSITFIDLCDCYSFYDNDFVDVDHISDIGSKKISSILEKNVILLSS